MSWTEWWRQRRCRTSPRARQPDEVSDTVGPDPVIAVVGRGWRSLAPPTRPLTRTLVRQRKVQPPPAAVAAPDRSHAGAPARRGPDAAVPGDLLNTQPACAGVAVAAAVVRQQPGHDSVADGEVVRRAGSQAPVECASLAVDVDHAGPRLDARVPEPQRAAAPAGRDHAGERQRPGVAPRPCSSRGRRRAGRSRSARSAARAARPGAGARRRPTRRGTASASSVCTRASRRRPREARS